MKRNLIPSAPPDHIVLVVSDGRITVPKADVKRSTLLRQLLEDSPEEQELHIGGEIDMATIKRVALWLSSNPKPSGIPKPLRRKLNLELNPVEVGFLSDTVACVEDLLGVLRAANFLVIPDLLEFTAAALADKIREKDTVELVDVFGTPAPAADCPLFGPACFPWMKEEFTPAPPDESHMVPVDVMGVTVMARQALDSYVERPPLPCRGYRLCTERGRSALRYLAYACNLNPRTPSHFVPDDILAVVQAYASFTSVDWENMVVLQTSDGTDFVVHRDVAALLEGHTPDPLTNAIQLPPDVTGRSMTYVLQYLQYHLHNPAEPIERPLKGKIEDVVCEFDQQFLFTDLIHGGDEKKHDLLIDVIMASNTLKLKPLLDLTCAAVASMIKGKTPDQIRALCNIENDFTPEEEEKIREENRWCEES